MTYLLIAAFAALLVAGFFLKQEETVAFLKSAWTWVAVVAAGVAQYFGIVDVTSWF